MIHVFDPALKCKHSLTSDGWTTLTWHRPGSGKHTTSTSEDVVTIDVEMGSHEDAMSIDTVSLGSALEGGQRNSLSEGSEGRESGDIPVKMACDESAVLSDHSCGKMSGCSSGRASGCSNGGSSISIQLTIKPCNSGQVLTGKWY